MSVRLRDVAALLEPDLTVDAYTEAESADWSKNPKTVTAVAFYAYPVGSTEEALTAETVIARWRGYLPATVKYQGTEVATEDLITPAWRIRWDGETYLIDGEIERHKTRRRTRYLSVVLKKVTS